MAKRKPQLPTAVEFLGYLDWHFISRVSSKRTSIEYEDCRTYIFEDGTRIVVDMALDKKELVSNALITLTTKVEYRSHYAQELSTVIECGLAAQYPTLDINYQVKLMDNHLVGVGDGIL